MGLWRRCGRIGSVLLNKAGGSMRKYWAGVVFLISVAFLSGCTVKAIGDPNRPITINAHITIDIKGMEKTASSIEDMVSGGQTK